MTITMANLVTSENVCTSCTCCLLLGPDLAPSLFYEGKCCAEFGGKFCVGWNTVEKAMITLVLEMNSILLFSTRG